MTYHQRHLPHWQPEGAALFVTWRLYGSLPKHVLVPQTEVTSGRAFLEFDRLLDSAVSGPMWLRDREIADIMVDALRYGENELRLYRLDAFVVMSNHVHVLMEP